MVADSETGSSGSARMRCVGGVSVLLVVARLSRGVSALSPNMRLLPPPKTQSKLLGLTLEHSKRSSRDDPDEPRCQAVISRSQYIVCLWSCTRASPLSAQAADIQNSQTSSTFCFGSFATSPLTTINIFFALSFPG